MKHLDGKHNTSDVCEISAGLFIGALIISKIVRNSVAEDVASFGFILSVICYGISSLIEHYENKEVKAE